MHFQINFNSTTIAAKHFQIEKLFPLFAPLICVPKSLFNSLQITFLCRTILMHLILQWHRTLKMNSKRTYTNGNRLQTQNEITSTRSRTNHTRITNFVVKTIKMTKCVFLLAKICVVRWLAIVTILFSVRWHSDGQNVFTVQNK